MLTRRAPLEGPDSFFFPLRLKMACALSLWICFMLTLIFYNLLDWAISVLCMAGKLEATMLAMRPHSDQLSHATHLANYPVLMLSLLASFPRPLRSFSYSPLFLYSYHLPLRLLYSSTCLFL